MALSRLFISGAKLHFPGKGFVTPTTTRLCSSSSSSFSKKEKKEYTQTHSEVLSKETQIQNEVGKPWYSLLGGLIKLTEKVFSNPQSGSSLTSESLDITDDTTTSEVIRTGKGLHGVELDKLNSRLQPPERSTDSNSHAKEIATCPISDIMSNESPEFTIDSTSCEKRNTDDRLDAAELHEPKSRLESSNNTQLVEQGNAYQQNEVDQGTLRYPGRDQEEVSMWLDRMLRGSNNNGEKANRTPDVAGSAEDASIEYRGLPPNKKLIVQMASIGSCEAEANSSTSGSAEEVLGLADQLNADTLEVKTSSSYLMETSREDSMKMTEIKSLLNQVKKLPKGSSQTSYDDIIVSNKINFLNDVSHPKDHSEAVVTDETSKHPDPAKGKVSLSALFTNDSFKNEVQPKGQMKVPKESSLSEVVLQEKDNSTLAKLRTAICDESDFLNLDDDTTKKVPDGIANSQLMNEFDNGNNSDDSAHDNRKAKSTPQILNPSWKEPIKKDPDTLPFTEKGRDQTDDLARSMPESQSTKKPKTAFRDYEHTPIPSRKELSKKNCNLSLLTEKGRDKTDVLVRFVPEKRKLEDVKSTFKDCGPVEEIHFIAFSNGRPFKDAYVRFKTKEGMRKALALNDPRVADSDVIVEPASFSTYTSSKIVAPNLIGVSDIPPALVKNPTRTVMVKGLGHNVASHHLEDAFSFCGARITGFFMGSSSSVGYIEFETEDAKEKAISACSIFISGSKLSILRIDAPNTTVVRLSNVQEGHGKITSICRTYGKCKMTTRRSDHVFDVHFRLDEWPSMVNILNSLNGQVVDGHQWIAQPATIIPFEILKYLWKQPDGRRQVYTLIQNLCEKIGEEDPMAEIKDLAAQYYEERID